MTLRKLKTTMPSLGCKACYVGQTSRHILTRFKEHNAPLQPVSKQFKRCGVELTFDNIDILKSSARGEHHLLTLEALFIAEKKPTINTKDVSKRRTLTIRLY